ncbi:MAG: ATP-binding cassette domain-containing protein [Paracoccaceae bacterium]
MLAFIGPSGSGKSTVSKCLNGMHDDTRRADQRDNPDEWCRHSRG